LKMLPIKKVYIDTKFKTKDSKSNSNFKNHDTINTDFRIKIVLMTFI